MASAIAPNSTNGRSQHDPQRLQRHHTTGLKFEYFYVENGELSCQMYQRSADMGLGVPFNIASYSLLTCMIAQVCGLSPGDFVHVIGDAHVYRAHVRPFEEQLQKHLKPFPVSGTVNPLKKDIDSFVASDFMLVGYDPHLKKEMKMAA